MAKKPYWLILAASLLLAACGGGGGGLPDQPRVNAVQVMGDSLADSGTFGFKFTVQGAAATGVGSTSIWPELVAEGLGVNALCPHFQINPITREGAVSPDCTNFAVGGGRINFTGSAGDPTSIPLQLQTAAALRGSYTAEDLILLVGGGNDAADLVGAFLGAASGGQGLTNFASLLSTLLGPDAVAALLEQPNGAILASAAYMTALADTFHAAITQNLTERGASKVVVLNMPDITLTPRFRAVLQGVALANGGGEQGAAAAVQIQAVIRQWIGAYNTRLAEKFSGNERVAIVNFNGVLTDQVNNPSQFGLTNVTDAACPAVGVGADQLPIYNLPTCTAAALSATTPPEDATGGADWWKTYIFSDGFHPTPIGHDILAQGVNAVLTARGWQ